MISNLLFGLVALAAAAPFVAFIAWLFVLWAKDGYQIIRVNTAPEPEAAWVTSLRETLFTGLASGAVILLIIAGIALLVLLAFVHPLAAIALVAVLWFLFSN